MGVKIAANDVDRAIAGTSLLVVEEGDNLEAVKEEAMEELDAVDNLLNKEARGVFVQASTLGSLEALLVFLASLDPPIPVASFNIGKVNQKDVKQASIMLEHRKEYATILAFDVAADPEAVRLAEVSGVRIFTADIIYHLFDAF